MVDDFLLCLQVAEGEGSSLGPLLKGQQLHSRGLCPQYLITFQWPHLHSLSHLEIKCQHTLCSSPLLLLPSIFPSIMVFSSDSVLHIRWLNHWSFQLQHQFFQGIFKTDFLYGGLVGSPCRLRDFQESSPITVEKHQFFRAQVTIWSNSHTYTWLLGKT